MGCQTCEFDMRGALFRRVAWVSVKWCSGEQNLKLPKVDSTMGMAEGLGGASCEPRGQVVGLRFSAM